MGIGPRAHVVPGVQATKPKAAAKPKTTKPKAKTAAKPKKVCLLCSAYMSLSLPFTSCCRDNSAAAGSPGNCVGPR